MRPRASFPFHLRPSPDFILQFPNAAIYSLCKTLPSLAFSTFSAATVLPGSRATGAASQESCLCPAAGLAVSHTSDRLQLVRVLHSPSLLLGSILTLSGDPGSYQGTNPVNYFGSVPTSCIPWSLLAALLMGQRPHMGFCSL